MPNFSLQQTGTTINPVAGYQLITNYDKKGNEIYYKNDIDLNKIGISNILLKSLMKNNTLKLIDLKVLSYIFYKLEKGSDIVILNPTIMIKHIDRKRSAISDSLKRLCQEKYINPKKGKGKGRCNYEINLLLFFSGDRIDFLENIDSKLIQRVS